LHHVGSNEAEIEMNMPNLINYARRKLLDQSINLAAAPYSGGPKTDFSNLPISISSGSFPAVPDANKKQNQSHTPLPTPSDPSHDGKQASQEQHKTFGNFWKYLVIIITVVMLVTVIIVLLCFWKKPAAKIIKPWNTGISGQLQKAFVTGISSNL